MNTIFVKIASENNFSGPAEWLEPDYRAGVEREVLYRANDLMQQILAFLRSPDLFRAKLLHGIGAWDLDIDTRPESDEEKAKAMLAEWLRGIGVLDELAEMVSQHYREPCPVLANILARAAENYPRASSIINLIADACAAGDVAGARRLVEGKYFPPSTEEAVDSVRWAVLAWCDGRDEDYCPIEWWG